MLQVLQVYNAYMLNGKLINGLLMFIRYSKRAFWISHERGPLQSLLYEVTWFRTDPISHTRNSVLSMHTLQDTIQ